MLTRELTPCLFNITVMGKDGNPEIIEVLGYSFIYNKDVWYIRENKQQWDITHSETGFYTNGDETQGGAILRLIKSFYDNPMKTLNETIENARNDLISKGIKLPVNGGKK